MSKSASGALTPFDPWVAVCGALSAFIQVTVVPTAMVRSGPKSMFLISTITAAPLAAALGCAWADPLAAALAGGLAAALADPAGAPLLDAAADGLGCAAWYWPLQTA